MKSCLESATLLFIRSNLNFDEILAVISYGKVLIFSVVLFFKNIKGTLKKVRVIPCITVTNF